VTDVETTRAGRHRQPRAPRPTRRLRLHTGTRTARPGSSLLKGLAIGTTASGVAAALVLPSAAGWASTPASAEAPAVAVAAPAAAAPERQPSFGVIGFTAAAKPKPKPRPTPVVKAPAPRPEPRAEAKKASRSVSFARSGLAVERGLSPQAIAVLNAVREEFPELDSFGGVRAGDPGDHGSGHAVDIMTSTSEGNAVADHLRGRAGELGITYLIWQQRRWSPGDSWVPMEDRGSPTANHMDHVHVSVS
jgi:hypothetical protein